jgi:tetratricopeptide (TPR) repeat protein
MNRNPSPSPDNDAEARDEALGAQLERHLEALDGGTPIPPPGPDPEVDQLGPVVERLHRLAQRLALPPTVDLAAVTVDDPGSPGHVTGSAAAAPTPPALGKFQVMRRLGGGGQAETVLALDPDLKRHVVLKLYHAARTPEEQEAVLREGQALARVRSPYVAQCYSAERQDGLAYLVVEYVPGQSLAQRLRAGRLSVAQALKLVRQLAEGLAAVHACGLLHRDIKPGNILLGNDGRPRLVDFGLAAALGSDALGRVSGTFAYMAPEQARGEAERIDPRTDLFGLGAVLYELLTGRAPYRAEGGQSLREAAAAGGDQPAVAEPGAATLPAVPRPGPCSAVRLGCRSGRRRPPPARAHAPPPHACRCGGPAAGGRPRRRLRPDARPAHRYGASRRAAFGRPACDGRGGAAPGGPGAAQGLRPQGRGARRRARRRRRGAGAGGRLEGWVVTGVAPLRLSEEQQRQLGGALALNREMVGLYRQGKYPETLTKAREALAIRRKILPPRHPDLAISLANLGRVLHTMGQDAEARQHMEEALAIRRKALPPLHPELALSLYNLGTLLYALGRRDEACQHLEEALAIRRKALPPLHPHLANSLDNLGLVLQDMGRRDEARKYHEEALAIRRKALSALHPNLASLDNLGQLHYAMGENEAAWRYMQEAATVSAAYTARTSAGSAQRDHAALVRKDRYELYAFLSLAEQSPLSAGQCHQVLASVVDGKALSGMALARRPEAVRLRQDPEVAKLLGRLQPLRRRLADLLLQGAGTLPPERYRELCAELQKEHDDLERELALRVKDYAELRRAEQAGPDALAQRLAPGSALVELVRYQRVHFQVKDLRKRWGADHYLAVLLWPDSGPDGPQVRLVPLGEAQSIDRAIHAWRSHVQSGDTDDKTDRELRRRLWEPLAKALPEGTTRLFIAPDGELALLPFEAIREADGTYLVERLHLSYLTTGRDLMPRPQPKDKPDLALVLADPDYDHAGDTGRPTPKTTPAATPLRGDDLTRQFKALKSLPGFSREADAVEKLLRGRPGWRVQGRRRADASEEALNAACTSCGRWGPCRSARGHVGSARGPPSTA